MPFEYAAQKLAMACGKWPWEWLDQPYDELMRALAIESAEARAVEMASKRRETPRG